MVNVSLPQPDGLAIRANHSMSAIDHPLSHVTKSASVGRIWKVTLEVDRADDENTRWTE